ncbi:MAG: tetratricopeptide repeat protein [Candidatus Yonathbacteria bacterium]|nr:tetratricopeptide repeat protein [Candidatus Yonathbacteria bacterium]NTW47369.1 tetratricopeptide repeat protein [Candidatus Yonathbacteria bacterium]
MKHISLSSLASWIFLVGVFFLFPLFFLPLPGVSVGLAKMTLFAGVIGVSAFLILIEILRKGEATISKAFVFIAPVVLFLIVFVSGLLSSVPVVSLIGNGDEMMTVSGIFIFIVSLYVAAHICKEEHVLQRAYVLLAMSAGLLVIYQVIHLFLLKFGLELLSFGMFSLPVSSPLGGWYDVGLFAGLVAILSLVATVLAPKKEYIRRFSMPLLIATLLLVILVNFSLVWWILASISLLLVVFSFSFGRSMSNSEDLEHHQSTSISPVSPLIVLLVSIVFLLPGSLDDALLSKLGTGYTHIRPSWQGTTDVVVKTVSTDIKTAILGEGPNRFTHAWLIHKPETINNTIAWDTDFAYGVSALSSFVVMTGILGAIFLLVFLVLFFFTALRGLGKAKRNLETLFPLVSMFALSLYSWIVALVYSPGIVMFAFAFVFSGVFLGLLVRERLVPLFTFSFLRDPRIGFFSVLVLVVALIGGLVMLYGVANRVVAASMFGAGITETKYDEDVEKGITTMLSALTLHETDTYDRLLAGVFIENMYTIATASEGEQSVIRERFQSALGNAINAAQRAVAYDASSYANHVALGDVYMAASNFGVSGAYESAIGAYTLAREHNPKNPAVILSFARLELGMKHVDLAKTHIAEALALKPDYAAAIFLLSQIEANAGNTTEAIRLSEQTIALAPNDIGALFQTGLLYYRNGAYTSAIPVLERAVAVAPAYANAKYFLALAYDRVGKTSEAKVIFESLYVDNPTNAELPRIIENLSAGLPALSGIESVPENRLDTPIEE